MKYVDEFKNPEAAHSIEKKIKKLSSLLPDGKTVNIMEVCGSHTMAIARYAIRDILPDNINLVSGPGCPVCVTDSGYIDIAIALSQRENTIVATFGDMINVPGGGGRESGNRRIGESGRERWEKENEHRTSNVQHRILNEGINEEGENAPSSQSPNPQITLPEQSDGIELARDKSPYPSEATESSLLEINYPITKSQNHQITQSPNHKIAQSPNHQITKSQNTLAKMRAEGAAVEVCYSPAKAIELAENNPDKEIVFLGIGFETTMVPVVAVVDIAIRENIKNFSILTAFKLVPPALEALATDPELNIDAFLCPAHVSAIIGANAYESFVEKHHIPCVIASFEPVDIMYGLQKILEQIVDKKAFVDNQYKRVVKPEGNRVAQKLLEKYLTPSDVPWRGIGVIPGSGLALREKFSKYDAEKRFNLKIKQGEQDKRCKCGDVLKGKIKPVECAMFAKACTPINPIGPCMVSSEGSCAAYYKYR